jgi:hypothetical protein
MNSQRSLHRPKRKFLKRALLVLAISAGLFFYAKNDSEKKETVRITQRVKTQEIEKTSKRKPFRLLARKYSRKMDLHKIIEKARNLPKDLDYDSFDCPLVGKEVDPMDKRAAFILYNTSVDASANPKSTYNFLRYHMPSGFFRTNDELKLNLLNNHIEGLKSERDVPGLVKTLARFHKLNLVWEGEQNLETLAGVYLDLYEKSKQGGPAPDLRCVIKNLRAIALMQDVLSALEGLVCQSHNQFQSSFAYMPDSLRRQVALKCFIGLKMDTLQKEIQKRLDELGNQENINLVKLFGTGSEYFSLVRQQVQLSVNGYQDAGFKRFYSGEKMSGDAVLGMHDDTQGSEVLIQSVFGPLKYGIIGPLKDPEFSLEETESFSN